MVQFSIGARTIVDIQNTDDCLINNIRISAGDDCRIEIMGLIANNSGLVIHMNNRSTLKIGPGQLMNGTVRIYQHEPSSFEVGGGCLWATCDIWSSDMHSLVDSRSGERLNFAEDIRIGSNVWLAANALVLKGARIEDGCVVGAHAVVTKSTPTEKNCLVAGNPGRIVKRNIFWNVNLIPKTKGSTCVTGPQAP